MHSSYTGLFYSSTDFVWHNSGEPIPGETFTHSHLSWSSIISYLLHPSYMIHGILPLQSTHLTILFHNLPPFSKSSLVYLCLGLAPSTSYTIHFFTQSFSSFRNTCPYHRSMFCCSTEIMSSNPSYSLYPLLRILSCSFTPHIHLTIFISAH